jgi:hypothetical protein
LVTSCGETEGVSITLISYQPKESLHAEASSHEPHQINWCEFVEFVSQKHLRKNLNSDEHFERPFSFMAMKGNYRIRKNMNKTLAEKTARASRFP